VPESEVMTSTETPRAWKSLDNAKYCHKKPQKYLKLKSEAPVSTILFDVH
jgi:hypothetical protein